MTNSEIGPFKKNFLLLAAWCFDFCLVVFTYLVIFAFAPKIVQPLCPYALSNTAIATTTYWYLPTVISLIISSLLLVIAPASPGRYLADLTAQSANLTTTLKRIPLILALPVLFIFTCGGIVSTYVLLDNTSKDKLDSPEDWAISNAVAIDDAYITWHDVTDPGSKTTKRYDYRVTRSLSKEHILTENDLEQARVVTRPSDEGFSSAKALNGRQLTQNLSQGAYLNIENILITGLEYKQRQLNYMAVAKKAFQKELQEIETEPISSDSLSERSQLLCNLGQAPAAFKLISSNLSMAENDLNLTKELFYTQQNMGLYKEALATCNKLIGQTPWLTDWYATAATISYSMGNYKESLAYLETAEKTLPFTLGEALGTTASFHKFKAQCLKRTGNHQASAKENELAQDISKRFMAQFSNTVIDIPVERNKIKKLEKILAHFNSAQLKGQIIEPHVYAPEAKTLVEQFENKKPSAKEIQEVLGKSLNQELDQLYQIKRKYDYSAAVAVKPLPPKKRELSKLAAELAKAW